jgi:hypothetical protein
MTGWYKQHIGVSAHGVAPVDTFLVVERFPWASGNTIERYYGDAPRACKGDTFSIDRAKDIVDLTIPSTCISRDRDEARLSVFTSGARTFEDGDRHIGLDATPRSPWIRLRCKAVRSAVTSGRRCFLGLRPRCSRPRSGCRPGRPR